MRRGSVIDVPGLGKVSSRENEAADTHAEQEEAANRKDLPRGSSQKEAEGESERLQTA